MLQYLSATNRLGFPKVVSSQHHLLLYVFTMATVLLRVILALILPFLCHGFVQFTNADFDIVQGRTFTITWTGATGAVDLYLQVPNTESFIGDTEATIARETYAPLTP